MKVTSVHRETRLLWTVGAFFVLAPIMGLASTLAENAGGLPPGSGLLVVLLVVLVAYMLGGIRVLQALGVRATWHIAVDDAEEHALEVSYSPSLVPPSFERWAVTLDDTQVLSQRGSIGLDDRLEFDLGAGPNAEAPHKVVIIVRLITLKPRRFLPLSLDVDGQRLLDI